MYFPFCITLIRLNDLVVKFAYHVSPSLGIYGDPFHIKLRSFKYTIEISEIRHGFFFFKSIFSSILFKNTCAYINWFILLKIQVKLHSVLTT